MTQQQLMEIVKTMNEASLKAKTGLLALFGGKSKEEIKQMLKGLDISELSYIVTYVSPEINENIVPAISELIIANQNN
jgi:hypothetical protein